MEKFEDKFINCEVFATETCSLLKFNKQDVFYLLIKSSNISPIVTRIVIHFNGAINKPKKKLLLEYL